MSYDERRANLNSSGRTVNRIIPLQGPYRSRLAMRMPRREEHRKAVYGNRGK